MRIRINSPWQCFNPYTTVIMTKLQALASKVKNVLGVQLITKKKKVFHPPLKQVAVVNGQVIHLKQHRHVLRESSIMTRTDNSELTQKKLLQAIKDTSKQAIKDGVHFLCQEIAAHSFQFLIALWLKNTTLPLGRIMLLPGDVYESCPTLK